MRKMLWDLEENLPASNWDGTQPKVFSNGFALIKTLGLFHAGDDTDEREYWCEPKDTGGILKVVDHRSLRRIKRSVRKQY